ncbi:MAG TPA: hypothetical protein VK073_01500 [Pseudogracilibacillus sp.]|nr:hypothetical protein [Pseudogracilibacillus sp.]
MRNKGIILGLFLTSVVLLLSACGNKEYDEAMENGINSVKNEDYKEAVDFFQEALEEKEDDDEASTYLEQTELFIDGTGLMDDADLDEATSLFEEIIHTEDGLSELEDVANEKLNEIAEMKELYEETEDALDKAETENDEGNYKESLEEIHNALDADLSHNYFKELKKDLEALKEDVEENQKLKKQAEQTLENAKQLESDEKYEAAISKIDSILEKELSQSGLKEMKEELETLKADLEKKLEEEAQQEEQQFAEDIQGYWAEDAPDGTPGIEIGKVTSNEWMFAILNSDVAVYAEIDSIDVDEDNNEINIKTTDGDVVEVTNFDGESMTVAGTKLHKFTKEEMEAKVDDSMSVDDIFDVENIKGMMEMNK